MNIAARIKDYRKINGLTQSQFAKMVGVKVNTVCRWETSKYFPNTSAIKKLSFLFNDDQDVNVNRKMVLSNVS